MSDKKEYAIHPGYIISINDGDRHYISFNRLIWLYKVDPKNCILWREGIGLKKDDYIHLYPQSKSKDYEVTINVSDSKDQQSP